MNSPLLLLVSYRKEILFVTDDDNTKMTTKQSPFVVVSPSLALSLCVFDVYSDENEVRSLIREDEAEECGQAESRRRCLSSCLMKICWQSEQRSKKICRFSSAKKCRGQNELSGRRREGQLAASHRSDLDVDFDEEEDGGWVSDLAGAVRLSSRR